MKKNILWLCSLLFLAAPVFPASGWTGYLTISSVQVATSGVIIISTSGQTQYNGCTQNKWVVTGSSETLQSRVYSVLLAAFSTGGRVQLWYTDGCASDSNHSVTIALMEK